MNVKVIFNTNKKLKDAAMKKARKEGLTYSAVLNIATQAYVGDRLEITALDRKLEQAREEIRQGRYYTHEQMLKMRGLKDSE